MRTPYLVPILFAGLFLFTYTAVQQQYRQNANDPQIQMAEDAAAALKDNQPYTSVLPGGSVDMATSLAPYVIVMDQNGKVLASNVHLGSDVQTTPPAGTLTYARKHGEDRFTWQPRKDVRQAAILIPFQNSEIRGYVLAGRSLRVVEQNENDLGKLAIAALLAMAALWLGLNRFAKR